MLDYLIYLSLLVFGLGLLLKGADILIDNAVISAKVIRVSNFLIGLTVVAFGTSLPELFVSGLATLQDKPDISVGNIIGSCIANIGLILGIAALIRPLKFQRSAIIAKMIILLVVSFIFTGLVIDQNVSRFDALILILLFIFFVVYSIRYERQNFDQPLRASPDTKLWPHIMGIFCGLAGVVLGSQLLINSATNLALLWGVSDLIIAVSMVAIGTSVPELATSLIAVIKKEDDISVANVVGSNIFNILFVLGLTPLIAPLAVSPVAIQIDIKVMLLFTGVIMLFFSMGTSLRRWQGLLLLLGYGVYIISLFYR